MGKALWRSHLFVSIGISSLPRLVAIIFLFGQIWFGPEGEQGRFNLSWGELGVGHLSTPGATP